MSTDDLDGFIHTITGKSRGERFEGLLQFFVGFLDTISLQEVNDLRTYILQRKSYDSDTQGIVIEVLDGHLALRKILWDS